MKDPASLLKISIFLLVAYYLYSSYEQEAEATEAFDNSDEIELPQNVAQHVAPKKSVPKAYQGDEQLDLTNPQAAKINLGACGNGQFLSSSLLPKDDPKLDDSFADFKPKQIAGNFIDSHKYAIGTQSQSLRNSNLQLRSEPANPQTMVCPWSQSTMAPDAIRPELEIGSGI
jgi:hypothetical protein